MVEVVLAVVMVAVAMAAAATEPQSSPLVE